MCPLKPLINLRLCNPDQKFLSQDNIKPKITQTHTTYAQGLQAQRFTSEAFLQLFHFAKTPVQNLCFAELHLYLKQGNVSFKNIFLEYECILLNPSP